MFQRQKLRKEFDQKFIELMEEAKKDWSHLKKMMDLSYGENEELRYKALLAKAKYVYLLREAKIRKISIK
ncbi:YaaL family protein [Siminovitchia sp. 179-K 8D1 HS]|uniref:YaaL family protein n=1 Tax=Siminovitchia sp. 179-K 8D1 HS TaxID=3142385 RepID=UPI00399FBD83